MKIEQHLSLDDLARTARKRLPKGVFGYVNGGAEDQKTLDRNASAFEEYGFRPRVLAGVANRSTEIELFGTSYSIPIGIAPMGLSALCWHRGDLELARAAAAERVPFVLSAASTEPMENIAGTAPGSWYQAYLGPDRSTIMSLLDRVTAAGISVLVVTVDVPVAAQRENEIRNGFTVPLRINRQLIQGGMTRPLWLFQNLLHTIISDGVPHFENFTAKRGGKIIAGVPSNIRSGRDALCWDDIEWIRSKWRGTLLIKGILHPSDAKRARDLGADGVIVSNHGGRQLDHTIASLRALPAVAEAAKEMKVLFDGGVRRATHALMARALGADLVLVGRPMMYGLAVAGSRGVRHALNLLKKEILVDLALLGCEDINQLTPEYLQKLR